jgi:hypothetical protein
LKDLDVGGRIILKLILKEYSERVCIGFIWFRIGQVGGWGEHGNEPSGSVKCRLFLDWLLKKDLLQGVSSGVHRLKKNTKRVT